MAVMAQRSGNSFILGSISIFLSTLDQCVFVVFICLFFIVFFAWSATSTCLRNFNFWFNVNQSSSKKYGDNSSFRVH